MKEKFAVIQIGGSQHIVSEGSIIDINRVQGNVGDKIKITDVFLYTDGKEVEIGNPTVNYEVTVEIMKQYRGKKIDVRIFKAKARYRRKIGHRQTLSQLKITKIAAKPSASKKSTSRGKTAKK